jgi:acetylornithine deacetylase/succinyl-diaminopimelate desuccinylase-like protein
MPTSSLKEAVFRTIDAQREQLIAFAAEYVATPSINPGKALPGETGDESVCQTWLAGRLREFGTFANVDVWEDAPGRPNVAGILGTNGGRPGLTFNGHTDTVEVTPDQRAAWTGDPWSGEIRDGLLFGRGAVDMKGGISAFMWAAKAVAEARVPLTRDVAVTASIAEETSEADIGPLSVLRRGYDAPLVVNAEPTDLRICPVGMGWLFVRITVEGRRLHPASRWTAVHPQPHGTPMEGVDAIDKLRPIMNAVAELDHDWALTERHPLMPPGAMGLSPVWIAGGDHRAAMSDSASVEYAVPFRPGIRSSAVLERIRAVIDGVAARDSWLLEHPPVIDAPVNHAILEPLDIDSAHPAVGAIAGAFESALRRTPELGCMPGPCDANFMAEAGTTTVVLGPGDLALGAAHGTDEHIAVEAIVDACKVYAALIVDICGPDPKELS